MDDVKSLGASTGLFGIIGAGLGYVIYNWQNMSYPNSPRNYILCQIAFMVIITFLFNGASQRTGAHIFGFIAGIFVGCCLSERFSGEGGMTAGLTSHEKMVRNIGIAVSIGMTAIFVALTMLH